MTQSIDIFNRRENKNFDSGREYWTRIEFEGAIENHDDLQAVLDHAHASGVSLGSARSGIFEIQTTAGIWKQVNSRRIDLSTPRRRSLVVFESWDSIEAAEEVSHAAS